MGKATAQAQRLHSFAAGTAKDIHKITCKKDFYKDKNKQDRNTIRITLEHISSIH